MECSWNHMGCMRGKSSVCSGWDVCRWHPLHCAIVKAGREVVWPWGSVMLMRASSFQLLNTVTITQAPVNLDFMERPQITWRARPSLLLRRRTSSPTARVTLDPAHPLKRPDHGILCLPVGLGPLRHAGSCHGPERGPPAGGRGAGLHSRCWQCHKRRPLARSHMGGL